MTRLEKFSGWIVKMLCVHLGIAKLVLFGCSVDPNWQPQPFHITPSLGDYFRAAGLLWSNAATRIQQEILFLPRHFLASLKGAVAQGCDQPITTGDIVQALSAMLIHAAEGKPLLPSHPKCMVVLVQIPGTHKGYFGNAVHPMPVGIQEGTSLPPEGDPFACIRALAARIRVCSSELRSQPAKALQAIYESQQVCNTPTLRALGFLAGRRLPLVTCTTNYIGSLPSDAKLDFGLKVKAVGYRSLTLPLARSMAVIRPSMPPYGEGLFLQLALTPAQAKSLRRHPVLASLVPNATFLGDKNMETPVKSNVGCMVFPWT
jgi:hypothetical protein